MRKRSRTSHKSLQGVENTIHVTGIRLGRLRWQCWREMFQKCSHRTVYAIFRFHCLGQFNCSLLHLSIFSKLRGSQLRDWKSNSWRHCNSNHSIVSMCVCAREREREGLKWTSSSSTCGSNMNFIASTNFSKENWSMGIGAGPTPLACTRSPQNGWSPKNGTIVVGHYTYWRSNFRNLEPSLAGGTSCERERERVPQP